MEAKNQTVECSLNSRPVECKLIDVPKTKPGDRPFTKDFAIKLSDSIKIDGLLQPIVVRPNPVTPGRYILVAGKHRLYATRNVLKEQFIQAVVIDMDEEEADIAQTVENLWRNPLSKAEHALHFQKWMAHWQAKHPKIGEAAKATEISRTQKSAEPEDGDSQTPGEANSETEAQPDAKPARKGDFDRQVAGVTGQSLASVRATKRLAESFSPEQLEVFTQMSVNQTDMTRIAKIKDEDKRGEVVNLVASGMEVDDAVKEVMKDQAPIRHAGGESKAETVAKVEAKEEKAPDLTDDEWFDRFCGEKAAMLKNPAKFKADALLFRAVTDTRHVFRCKAKKALQAIKKAGVYGAFWNLVNRFVSVSHPKDWLICGECKGEGVNPAHLAAGGPSEARCLKCFGGGYLLKTEEYL